MVFKLNNSLSTELNNIKRSNSDLDDIPGRIDSDIELCFSGLKKRKPIYDILNL